MLVFAALLFIALLTVTILMCWQESQVRKINFWLALLLCLILSPFFGYLIIGSVKLRKPRGCNWCKNAANEAEYCYYCGKNEEGNLRKALAAA